MTTYLLTRRLAVAIVAAVALFALPQQHAAAQGTPPAGPGAKGAPPAAPGAKGAPSGPPAGQQAGTPPVVIMLEITVNQPDIQKFLTAVNELGEAAVKGTGVLEFDILAPKDPPNHIVLYEVYESEATHQAHLKSPEFNKFKTATASMIKESKDRQLTPVAFNSKK